MSFFLLPTSIASLSSRLAFGPEGGLLVSIFCGSKVTCFCAAKLYVAKMKSKCCVYTVLIILFASLNLLIDFVNSKSDKSKIKAEKIGKNVMDYTDADMHRLLDQWNDNDDDYDPEEENDPRLPPKTPDIKLDPKMLKKDPQAFLKMAKKNKPVMMFATVAGNPSRKRTEDVSSFWQQSLLNANIQFSRYIIADNRILLHLDDGSLAWQIKDFLVKQKDCEVVEFENQKFPGAGAPQMTKSEL